VGSERGDRQLVALAAARNRSRDRSLRPMSRSAGPNRRGLRSGQAVLRLLSSCAPHEPAIPCRWPTARRGLQLGLVLAEQDVRERCYLQRLPQPAQWKVARGGNSLCATCHLPSKYDTPAHHHHKAASAGAACVACHMPNTTYMVIDPQHDHSLRVLRPDLCAKLGTPNTCDSCHTNHDARWAVTQVNKWYGHDLQGYQRFAAAFAAAGADALDAQKQRTRASTSELSTQTGAMQ
jgi:hypothetical protein